MELGFFDWDSKEYRRIPLREQVEVLALTGDIALGDRGPAVHAHVIVGKSDGTAHGGHLLAARVRPTLELGLTATPERLRRAVDPESQLPLMRLPESARWTVDGPSAQQHIRRRAARPKGGARTPP